MVHDGGPEPAQPAAHPAPAPHHALHQPLHPVATDDRRAVAVGLAVWVVALVTCLLRLDHLRDSGDGWWIGVCVAGILLGLAGLVHLQRRRVARRMRERRTARAAPAAPATPPRTPR